MLIVLISPQKTHFVKGSKVEYNRMDVTQRGMKVSHEQVNSPYACAHTFVLLKAHTFVPLPAILSLRSGVLS